MTKSNFNKSAARARLRKQLFWMRDVPEQAGNVARIYAVLDIPDWPYSLDRYEEFCMEVKVNA